MWNNLEIVALDELAETFVITATYLGCVYAWPRVLGISMQFTSFPKFPPCSWSCDLYYSL